MGSRYRPPPGPGVGLRRRGRDGSVVGALFRAGLHPRHRGDLVAPPAGRRGPGPGDAHARTSRCPAPMLPRGEWSTGPSPATRSTRRRRAAGRSPGRGADRHHRTHQVAVARRHDRRRCPSTCRTRRWPWSSRRAARTSATASPPSSRSDRRNSRGDERGHGRPSHRTTSGRGARFVGGRDPGGSAGLGAGGRASPMGGGGSPRRRSRSPQGAHPRGVRGVVPRVRRVRPGGAHMARCLRRARSPRRRGAPGRGGTAAVQPRPPESPGAEPGRAGALRPRHRGAAASLLAPHRAERRDVVPALQ